jgi:hypothetical protein
MAGELGHVVIEHSDPLAVGDAAAALRNVGFSVRLCPGPVFRRGGDCPVVSNGRCQVTDRADVIVHSLDVEDPFRAAVELSLRRSYPGTPVITGVPAEDADLLVDVVIDAARYLQRPRR